MKQMNEAVCIATDEVPVKQLLNIVHPFLVEEKFSHKTSQTSEIYF